jgi:hypothetical protein
MPAGRKLTETKIVKWPRWLRWRIDEKSSDTKADKLDDVRRRTDQMIKQQDAQKKREEETEKKN